MRRSGCWCRGSHCSLRQCLITPPCRLSSSRRSSLIRRSICESSPITNKCFISFVFFLLLLLVDLLEAIHLILHPLEFGFPILEHTLQVGVLTHQSGKHVVVIHIDTRGPFGRRLPRHLHHLRLFGTQCRDDDLPVRRWRWVAGRWDPVRLTDILMMTFVSLPRIVEHWRVGIRMVEYSYAVASTVTEVVAGCT